MTSAPSFFLYGKSPFSCRSTKLSITGHSWGRLQETAFFWCPPQTDRIVSVNIGEPLSAGVGGVPTKIEKSIKISQRRPPNFVAE